MNDISSSVVWVLVRMRRANKEEVCGYNLIVIIGARAPHTQPEPSVRTFCPLEALAKKCLSLSPCTFDLLVGYGFCYYLFARVSIATFTAHHDNTLVKAMYNTMRSRRGVLRLSSTCKRRLHSSPWTWRTTCRGSDRRRRSRWGRRRSPWPWGWRRSRDSGRCRWAGLGWPDRPGR